MAQSYPSIRYRADGETVILRSKDEEAEYHSDEWRDSPAAFGIETCPGEKPDADIRKNLPSPAKKK